MNAGKTSKYKVLYILLKFKMPILSLCYLYSQERQFSLWVLKILTGWEKVYKILLSTMAKGELEAEHSK